MVISAYLRRSIINQTLTPSNRWPKLLSDLVRIMLHNYMIGSGVTGIVLSRNSAEKYHKVPAFSILSFVTWLCLHPKELEFWGEGGQATETWSNVCKSEASTYSVSYKSCRLDRREETIPVWQHSPICYPSVSGHYVPSSVTELISRGLICHAYKTICLLVIFSCKRTTSLVTLRTFFVY